MAKITALRRIKKDSGFTSDNQCIRIVLEDGTTLRYTDCLYDLTTSFKNQNGVEVPTDQVTYSSIMGFNLSAVGGDSNEPSLIDLEGVLGPLGYTREQIAQGLFENARIYVFLTDRERPIEDEEKLFSGFWGETTTLDGRYITKFTSLLSIMEIQTTRVFSQFCDTKLGSTRCGVKMSATSWENTGLEYIQNFDPLTSLNISPVQWFDFSDLSTITLQNGQNLQEIRSKVVSDWDNNTGAYRMTGTSGTWPRGDSNINGRRACYFLPDDVLIGRGTSSQLSDIVNSSEASSFDMFLIFHDPNKSSPVTIIGGSQGMGPFMEPLSANTELSSSSGMRAYRRDVSRIVDRGSLWDYTSNNPSLFMCNFVEDNLSTTVGAVTTSGYNQGGFLLGEILVYPQLKNSDRQLVMNYLADKWGISLSGNIINTSDNKDARTRTVVKADVSEYVWFEAGGNGQLGGSEPVWNTSVGGTTEDGDILWTTVPARVLQLTVNAGNGTDSQFTLEDSLPIGFDDTYANGFFEVISGVNKGVKGVIISHNLNTFSMNYPTLKEFNQGDVVQIKIGCDKTKTDCRLTFKNIKNFQGFDLPQKSAIFKSGKR